MDTKIYSHEGKEVGTMALPGALFAVAWNQNLVHEVVTGMQANARESTAHTKDRSEVRGGGKKPWKQKGTGRARHGSSRSPIWVGGGVAHGPRSDKDYSVKINKKVRAKALASVFSKKFTDAELVLVDAISLSEPKTAMGKSIIKSLALGTGLASLATKRKNAALLILPARNEATEKSFRNFGNIEVIQAKDVNPVNLLTYKYVLIVEPKTTLALLEKRVAAVTKATK